MLLPYTLPSIATLLIHGELSCIQVVVAIPLYQLEYYDRGKTYTCQQFPLRLAWAVTVREPTIATSPCRLPSTTLSITHTHTHTHRLLVLDRSTSHRG